MIYLPSGVITAIAHTTQSYYLVKGFSVLLAAIALWLFAQLCVATFKLGQAVGRWYNSDKTQAAIADINDYLLSEFIYPLFVRVDGDR